MKKEFSFVLPDKHFFTPKHPLTNLLDTLSSTELYKDF